uniref:Uncharacterized protein n=1 Tax=Tanacetum cinerariifolium TaxID=118510 RepID=A0A6L2M5A1_TANCI|nr:hypothetical protein [Tanacetum cinerariifolium]
MEDERVAVKAQRTADIVACIKHLMIGWSLLLRIILPELSGLLNRIQEICGKLLVKSVGNQWESIREKSVGNNRGKSVAKILGKNVKNQWENIRNQWEITVGNLWQKRSNICEKWLLDNVGNLWEIKPMDYPRISDNGFRVFIHNRLGFLPICYYCSIPICLGLLLDWYNPNLILIDLHGFNHSGFLDSGGGIGTEKKSNVIGMSGFSVDSGFPSLSQVAVAEVNVVSSDTPNATSDLGNNSNHIEVGHESAMKKTPTSYVNKLSHISLTKANLCKLDASCQMMDGPWMIRGALIFLNNWSPSVSLLKEELSRVPVWVKFHDVPLVAYTSDGLSLIAMKIGTPMMLDSYMNSMCLESWGSNSYARILIKIYACNGFSDNLIMVVLELKGLGYTKETIRVEYKWEPPRCSTCLLFGHSVDDYPKAHKRVVNRVGKGKGKSFGTDDEGFIEMKKDKLDASPKKASSAGKSSNQTDMTNATTLGNGIIFLSNSFEALNDDDPVSVKVESGTKASTFGVQEEGNSSTPLVEKIYRFKQQLMDGKCVLMDEDGKPVEKVDYLGDHDSEDEVEPDDNKMTSFLASKPSRVGYGTKSLLEQWRETYGDYEQEYNYDPYNDDMYEGQDIPDNIHTICNNLDIKVRDRSKK